MKLVHVSLVFVTFNSKKASLHQFTCKTGTRDVSALCRRLKLPLHKQKMSSHTFDDKQNCQTGFLSVLHQWKCGFFGLWNSILELCFWKSNLNDLGDFFFF